VDELKDIKAHCYFPHDLVLRSSYYELGIMLKECYIGYLLARREVKAKPAFELLPKD
jgi:hypothetical protein